MKDKQLQENELKIAVTVSSFFMGTTSLQKEKYITVTLLSIALNTRHNLIRIDAPLPIDTIGVSMKLIYHFKP